MTTPIEVTRREMYRTLAILKINCQSIENWPGGGLEFESALEAHLDELRKAMVQINESTVACAHHSAESFLDLENRLAAMTEERDQIQQRLHAIDHAYCEQSNTVSRMASEIDNLKIASQAAGEELRAAHELIQNQRQCIQRQREVIWALYMSNEARNEKSATQAQDQSENASEEIRGALLHLCQHSWRDQFADLSGKRQKQCIFCLTIREG